MRMAVSSEDIAQRDEARIVTCANEGRLAGQQADVGTELAALHARTRYPLAPRVIAADDAYCRGQEYEYAGTDASLFVQPKGMSTEAILSVRMSRPNLAHDSILNCLDPGRIMR